MPVAEVEQMTGRTDHGSDCRRGGRLALRAGSLSPALQQLARQVGGWARDAGLEVLPCPQGREIGFLPLFGCRTKGRESGRGQWEGWGTRIHRSQLMHKPVHEAACRSACEQARERRFRGLGGKQCSAMQRTGRALVAT